MRNSSKGIIAAFFLVSVAAGVNGLAGQAGDYDPVTGEPDCTKCHTADRRYSIDYTRDDTCAECHGPGLSPSYIEMDGRYGPPHGAFEAEKYARAAAGSEKAKAAGKKQSAPPEEMVLVPEGEFTMGSNDWWPKSQPEHKVRLDSFFIDKYEVTNKRFKRFVDLIGRPHPEHWTGGLIPKGKEDHPVVYVSWADADAFCKWEGKRLPTEQEWEKAARSADGRAFPWGDKFDRNKGNTPQYGNEDTLPVGSFENGMSPYGVYDLAGNAFEWTDSWFKPHPGNTHDDENYGEKYKVLKGGSWYDCTYYKCGISAPAFNRIFFHTLTRNNNFGFRCAKNAR